MGGLYRGTVPNIGRNCIINVGETVVYDAVKVSHWSLDISVPHHDCLTSGHSHLRRLHEGRDTLSPGLGSRGRDHRHLRGQPRGRGEDQVHERPPGPLQGRAGLRQADCEQRGRGGILQVTHLQHYNVTRMLPVQGVQSQLPEAGQLEHRVVAEL